MNRKYLSILISFILLVLSHTNLFSQTEQPVLELEQLVVEGIEKNPVLNASMNEFQAAKAKIPQAGSLPDPTLSFNLMNIPINSFELDQEAMTGKQLAFMQPFPFPGKLGLKEKIAEEAAKTAKYQYEENKIQLINQIKQIYYSLYYFDHAIEITTKNKTILYEFVKIAETRYSVGKGIQQDVLKAQVELSKLEDKLINLKRKRESFAANLNKILNRDAGSFVTKTGFLEFNSYTFTPDQLENQAEKNKPAFKAYQALIRKSQKGIKLAKKQYWPDFSLGIAYTQREVLQNGMGGNDFISGVFSMKVPLYFWKKQRKKVEETSLMKNKVEDIYSDIRNGVFAGIDDQLQSLKKNSELIELYKSGIIPQASQSLNSAIAGYQTDKVNFLTLLHNQIVLFNYELEYLKVLSNYYKNLTRLEALTGTNL
ncbi:MAG: TolC family protein [Calditrichia bacterium]|nr:TolC family protein [Calditrichia bacterium]